MTLPARKPRRPGFTIIEVLVVIAIIGILVAMLMPALQSARETARKTACSNNLKQIGAAMAGYESSRGSFPPGVFASAWRSGVTLVSSTELTGPVAKFGFYYWTSFLHDLLPRVEEQAYYDGLRGPLFRVTPLENGTSTTQAQADYARVSGLSIQPYLCPSDTQVGPLWRTPAYTNVTAGALQLAKSNYLGIFSGTNLGEGLQRVDSTASWTEQPLLPFPPRLVSGTVFDRRAVFGFGQGTTAQSIKDGLANTMAVAEYLRGVSDRDGRGAFWYNDAGMQMLHARRPPNSPDNDLLHPARVSSVTEDDWGCRTEFQKIGRTVTTNNLSPSNQPSLNLPCLGGTDVGDRTGADCAAAARSRHRAGVNVLFCDGHVQFIDDTIDSSNVAPYGTWQRLAWIDDRLPVNLP